MKKKVLLLHGWGGSDYPHWQSWLAGELAKNYGCVNFLRFSDVDHPKLNIWTEELQQTLDDFQPDIVICHSLANTLWFHIAHKTSLKEIEKLYLVAPPSLNCKIEELKEFFPISLPQNLYAKEICLITSNNDPYMTPDEAKKLQKALKVKMKTIQNGGHINAESGFGEWPWMLEEIQKH